MAQDPNIDAAKDALDQIAAKDAVEAALIADLRAQLASMTAERDALQVLLDACDHDHTPDPEPDPDPDPDPDGHHNHEIDPACAFFIDSTQES